MFIEVRYGYDQRCLFNPNCRIANLLTEIRNRCSIEKNPMSLDLCDESGLIKDLPLNVSKNGAKLLPGTGSYVLVERVKRESDASTTDLHAESIEDGLSMKLSEKENIVALLMDADKLIPGFYMHRGKKKDGMRDIAGRRGAKTKMGDRTTMLTSTLSSIVKTSGMGKSGGRIKKPKK